MRSSEPTRPRESLKHMQCMEVWGGNRSVDSGVIMPGVDAWVFSQPYQNDGAGGDVHYLSTCCGGSVVRMVVADIAGHGTGVAETGTHLRLLMRRFINHQDQLSVVRDLNREFTAASTHGVFATAVVMTFESKKNTLVVSNAGHPPPLWYQAKRRRWTLLQPQTAADAGGLPWGIHDEATYEQFQAPLSVGDIILCYTDALAESRDPSGEFLGSEGLLRIAGGVRNAPPSQLIPTILSEIEKHDPTYATRDDVTCLAFRPNGLRPAVPTRDLLLAPFRWALASAGLKFGYSGWKRDPWNAPIESAGD
jgi:sigma-B regulation protein RsbU (phosphoserine phosphatase)